MADPRNAVSFEGIGYEAETFLHDTTIVYNAALTGGAAQVGLACALVAATAKTCKLTEDGDAVLGKLVKVESDGKCVVQSGGWMTLPSGAGASLTRGKKIVGDLDGANKGYIREVATATAAELGVARGMIIDPTDTAAVVVRLETAT